MADETLLALAGFGLITGFMVLIMTGRITALVGLVLLPLAAASLLGKFGAVGGMIFTGIRDVSPTATLVVFAILYFSIMIDAGLFRPLVDRIIRWVGDDPLRLTVGTALLATIVSLDGDGTTTVLVCATALLPVYQRLRVDVRVFGTIVMFSSALLNITPWGGPAVRVASVLKVDPANLFVPILPAIGVGIIFVIALGWHLGRKERRRLATLHPTPLTELSGTAFVDVDDSAEGHPTERPSRFVANLILTTLLMAAVVGQIAPIQALFLVGTAIALMLNYPRVALQRERIAAHAPNILNVVILILAAGAFTGILSGTGMTTAMAATTVHAIPSSSGPYLNVVTALLSMPFSFFLSNDAYYFGVLPVLAETAAVYGFSADAIGRASLLGQPFHALSPLVAVVYFVCSVMGIELADFQRFALRYAAALALVTIAAAWASGGI